MGPDGRGGAHCHRGRTWHQSVVHQLLGNPVYTGTWAYGRTRNIASDEGTRVFAQPADTWIAVPVPPLVDAETFARAQAAKRARQSRAKRNTRVLYLLQHLLRCAACGRTFQAKSRWRTHALRQGVRVTYDLEKPHRYYAYTGRKLRLRCRERLSIRADRLEGRVWEEVKGVLQQPGVVIAGIEALGQGDGESLADEQAQAERDLRAVRLEEERLVRLYVTGKLSEEMLDAQRKYITERLEHLRAKVEDYRTRAATEVTREQLADSVRAWTERVGAGLEALTEEEKRDVLQDVVDEITVDGENNLTITIAIPTDGDEHIAPPVSRNDGAGAPATLRASGGGSLDTGFRR
ncbi:MAG: recombinase family protein [Chloroflexota bacterium]|nr:recombinase family protein [Chloroflexota bacterium]